MNIRSLLTLLGLIRAVKLVQIFLLIASIVLVGFFIESLTSICIFFNHLGIHIDDFQSFFWKVQIVIAAAFYLIAILLVLPNLLRRLSKSEVSRLNRDPYGLYDDLIFRRGLIGTTYSIKRNEPIAAQFESKNLFGADVYLRHSLLTNKKFVLPFILAVVLIQAMVISSVYSAKGILIKFIVIHCAGFLFYETTLFLFALLLTSRRKNENE